MKFLVSTYENDLRLMTVNLKRSNVPIPLIRCTEIYVSSFFLDEFKHANFVTCLRSIQIEISIGLRYIDQQQRYRSPENHVVVAPNANKHSERYKNSLEPRFIVASIRSSGIKLLFDGNNQHRANHMCVIKVKTRVNGGHEMQVVK